MIRVLIADDHAVVRRGLRQIVADEFAGAIIGEAADADGVIAHARESRWDVVVLDLSMPGRSGLEVLKELKQLRPKLPVLILSAHPEEQYAVRTLKAGAAGYLTKETAPEELARAVEKALKGGKYVSATLAERLVGGLAARGGSGDGASSPEFPHASLSDREYEIMCAIASGRTVSEIARDLALSVKTVSTYRARVLEKLRLRTNAELTHYAIRNKLVS